MRASLSTWIKLAAAVASMPVDLIHAFMNPPTGSGTLTLKNRRFHMQSQVGDNDQSSQFPNVTPSPPSPSPSPPIPFGIRLTGGPELNRDGYTGKGIKVAVIDSGIDKTHPGFREGKVKVGKKFEDEGSLKYHGTHVAGTIHMMAPDAEIYDYCVFKEVRTIKGTAGTDNEVQPNFQPNENTADEYIKQAIDDAIAKECDIINMSFARRESNQIPPYEKQIEEARNKGIIIVAAAGVGDGNATTDERIYSGYSENTINIASCGLQEGSFGLVVGSNSASNDRIDFAGIGEDVISFKPNEDDKTTAEDRISIGARIKGSGTSFAASHVTGFIAALLDKEQTQDKNYNVLMTEGGLTARRKEDLLTLLKDKFVIDMKQYGDGKDNATGEGFLTYLDETEFMTQQLSENFRQQTDAIQTMTQTMTQTMLQRYSDNFRRQAEVLQKMAQVDSSDGFINQADYLGLVKTNQEYYSSEGFLQQVAGLQQMTEQYSSSFLQQAVEIQQMTQQYSGNFIQQTIKKTTQKYSEDFGKLAGDLQYSSPATFLQKTEELRGTTENYTNKLRNNEELQIETEKYYDDIAPQETKNVQLKTTSTTTASKSTSTAPNVIEKRIVSTQPSGDSPTVVANQQRAAIQPYPGWGDDDSPYKNKTGISYTNGIYEIYHVEAGGVYIRIIQGEEDGFSTSYYDNYRQPAVEDTNDWNTIIVNSFQDDTTGGGGGPRRIVIPNPPKP